MRTVLSYLLLLTLALSGLSGSVQQAHAYTLADAMVQHTAPAAEADMPCHSVQTAIPDDTNHSCCEQAQHKCKGDCCTKHCAAGGALLATELFRYIRPHNTVARLTSSLPQWLFTEDPPPPINA
ncbi:hypothetical protein [Rheinheimera pacifica]|uniref:hypothetical protein n=1 Tax=Rheinheimera pacifica TaxID=173990 RepID=UPI002ED81C12